MRMTMNQQTVVRLRLNILKGRKLNIVDIMTCIITYKPLSIIGVQLENPEIGYVRFPVIIHR
jgi:hypothetical protein